MIAKLVILSEVTWEFCVLMGAGYSTGSVMLEQVCLLPKLLTDSVDNFNIIRCYCIGVVEPMLQRLK